MTVFRGKRWIASYFGDWIYCKLQGARYTTGAGKDILSNLRRDDKLDLEREPSNPHDSNAIQVKRAGHHLGYVPKEIARELAPRIDEGDCFICLLLDNNPKNPRMRIRLHPLKRLPKDHPWQEQLENG